MAEVNEIRTHTKANIKTTAIKAITTKVIEVYIRTNAEILNRVIIMDNLEAEAVAEAEAVIVAVVMASPIIKVILITNTISIMVMMMSTTQINMVHHVHYAVAPHHSPKHCFKGEHDINDIMEKMNISGHQSQSGSLYF